MAYPQWLFSILKIGFVLSSFLLLSPATRAQSVSSAACATGVHAILARGQGAGNDLDVLTSIQSLLLGSINGSTSTALPYAYDSSDKVAAVHNGALLLQEYVQEYVSSCPDSKIFILGYSLGAVLMMDALCGTSSAGLWPVNALNATYSKNIIMAVAYGDETYVPGQSWNDGTCKVGMGEFPRLRPSTCDPFADSLHSFCDYGDTQCCQNPPLANNSVHHLYFIRYNKLVLDLTEKQLSRN